GPSGHANSPHPSSREGHHSALGGFSSYRPPDNEQWFDQNGQVREVLDQLLDPSLELHRANHSDLEAKVTQGTAQVILDGDGLRLQQLAVGQEHAQLLTAQRLHMHWTIKSDPHHLRDAARVIAVRLVDLRLQH